MKLKIIKIISCFLIMCMCLLAFQIKPKAQSSNTTFEPFEVGMTFPAGYEITYDNSDGIISSKTYYFNTYGLPNSGFENIMVEVYVYLNSEGFVYSFDGEEVDMLQSVILGSSEGELVSVFGDLELVGILPEHGDGELGVYTEIVEEPNVIYSGTYELLANLIYGTTENLSSTHIGTLEFISMIITILCVMLPFIILFFILRKLVD